jgi:asparagine synthase (glutamine-hydrolysing)
MDRVVRDALAAMDQAQRHRGPDDSGQTIHPFGDRILGLGHRRLSIIDLSAAGHQPMVHPLTGDELIFNGEIYNFQELKQDLLAAGESFVGHGDTEVLLHALSRWGVDCLPRLKGMFAFAFFNSREQTLLLARDSVGIKPLYLAQIPDGIVFASEVRGILASGLVERKLDMQGVAGLLAYGAVQSPLTVVKGIRSFPAGCYLVIHANGKGLFDPPRPFWTYPARQPGWTEQEVLERLETTLNLSIREHLISDVPVGVFLSSGLDSTIIAGLAAHHTTRVRTFTVGFADQPDMSESPMAAQTAREFGLEHTDITINGPEAEAATMAWAQSLDQPSVDGLNVYLISKVVRAQGITVALSGQGGDELFGGYNSFYDVPRLRRMMNTIAWLPRPLRTAFARMATVGRSEAVRQKFIDLACSPVNLCQMYLQRRRAMSNHQLGQLGIHAGELDLDVSFQPRSALEDLMIDRRDPTWSISQLESRFYQGNMLLRDGDANGMAHGLEIRVPMLDQRMLDLLLATPGKVRLPAGRANKHLLRVAFAPFLRPTLLNQSKRGFTLPIRRWMAGPMRNLCEHALSGLKSIGCLRSDGIDGIWQSFLSAPESQIWSRAFTLCALGLYIRRNQLT